MRRILSHAANKETLFIVLVFVQVIIIGALTYNLLSKRHRILGTTYVNTISKESVVLNDESRLNYFYEPKSNEKEHVNEWGPYIGTYLINADSLHDRFDYDTAKNAATFRIITLGDSYTYGLYVDTQNNWPEQLEDMLNQQCRKYESYEVINLGVHGYDLEYAAERFRIRGLKYSPDFVLWLMKDDDLLQVNEIMLEKLEEYLPDHQGSEAWNRAYRETYEEMGLKGALTYQKRVLKDFFSMYEGNLGIVTFPRMRKFSITTLSDVIPTSPSVRSIILDDLYADNSMYYKDDLHPTTNGHAAIAENVLFFFKENSYCN